MRISDWSSDVCSSDLLTPILYNLVSHVLTCTGVGRNPFTRERLFAGSIASHRGDAAALRRAALSCGYFRGADGARHRGRLGHGAGDGEGLCAGRRGGGGDGAQIGSASGGERVWPYG